MGFRASCWGSTFYLATVCPFGLEEGLDDKLVAEDAVASLDAGEEFTSIRFAARLRLREAFVKLEGQLGGVDTSGRGAHTQRQAGDRREVNAGAKRVAHEAGEEPVALAAGEPGNRRAPGRRRGGGRAVEQRHRAAVEVVPQLERRRRRRRLGVRVAPAAEAPGDDNDGRLVGSVVPERAELLVRRRPRGRGRGREQAGQAARVAVGARRRRRGRRGRARRRAARAGLVLRRRVDGGARRAGVHGYRRHGHGRRKPSSLCQPPTTTSEAKRSLLQSAAAASRNKPNPLLQFRSWGSSNN